MWKKWARVSNWIDLVCYTFDKQYKWGSDPETAAMWTKDAKAGFEKKWEGAGKTPLTADEKARNTEAFGPYGYATAGKMKFPRLQGPPGTVGAPAGSGPYRAHGWGHAGNDAHGVGPAIEFLTDIT